MSGPATYSFGADAVRYGSDLAGQNSAYFLPNENGGGAPGVVQLVAGTNITLSPSSGEGIVTINASGGSGAVSSVSGSGAGIAVTPTTGAVVVSNTGVTSLAGSGAGIGVSASSGAVTLSNTGVTALVAGTNVTLSGSTGAVTVGVATTTNNPFLPLATTSSNALSDVRETAPLPSTYPGSTEIPGLIQFVVGVNQQGNFNGAIYNNSGWFAVPVVAGTPTPAYMAINTNSATQITGNWNVQGGGTTTVIGGVECWLFFVNGEKTTVPSGATSGQCTCLRYR